MGRKWFVLVDRYGLLFAPPRSVLVEFENAFYIRHVVFNAFRELLSPFRLPSLSVYANWVAFCRGDPPLKIDESVCAFGATEKSALVVVAPLEKSALPAEPATPRYGTCIPVTTEDVVWLGSRRGTVSNTRGIDLADSKTLPRCALTNRVVEMLEETRVVHVISPPMTGKTALATLVCRELHNRSVKQQPHQPRRVAIARVSMRTVNLHEPFRHVFLRECGINWDQFLALRDNGYKIYIVVDDCQALYKSGSDGPQRGYLDLWRLVEEVLENSISDVRVLLLACHAYAHLVPPVQVPTSQQLWAKTLLFSPEEIEEYVARWFGGVKTLEKAMSQFCALLRALTGDHVGFCATAIQVMNEMYISHLRCVRSPPTADEWIATIQLGALNKRRLVKPLEMTSALRVYTIHECGKNARLERLLYGVSPDASTNDDEAFIRGCISSGILEDREDGQPNFFTPTMWRHFVKECVTRLPRATDAPATLKQLMERVQQEMDFTGVHKVLCREPSNILALERACQLALYKAVYRSTPPSFRTSVDDGALFGSSEFLDFMVRQGQTRWGIELIRDVSKWHELVARFAPGGRYALLGLSGYCVVRFHRAVGLVESGLSGTTAEATSMRWISRDNVELLIAALLLSDIASFFYRHM